MNSQGRLPARLNEIVEVASHAGKQIKEAEVLSRPLALKRDGVNTTYCCDVRLNGFPSTDNPDSLILRNVPIALVADSDLTYAEVGAAVWLASVEKTGLWQIIGYSKRKPGSRGKVAVTLPALTSITGERSGSELLALSGMGAPDTGAVVVGVLVDETVTVRVLTLEELSDTAFGLGFGWTPLGAYGLFLGATLLEVRT